MTAALASLANLQPNPAWASIYGKRSGGKMVGRRLPEGYLGEKAVQRTDTTLDAR